MKKYSYIVYLLVLMLLVFGIGKLMERVTKKQKIHLPEVPAVYSNILNDDNQNLVLIDGDGKKWPLQYQKPEYTLEQFLEAAEGYKNGVRFDFGEDFDGRLYYGFIDRSENTSSYPVYFRKFSEIVKGKAEINIKEDLSGKYDMVSWQETGLSELGYRVMNESGKIVYDGRVVVYGKGPFRVGPGLVEGPFVNKLTHEEVTISFRTNKAVKCRLAVNGEIFSSRQEQLQHEIRVKNLMADSLYTYHLLCGDYKYSSSFRTAPAPGSRTAFTFGFTSDSRAGQGGGERDIHGVNAYMMKNIAAFANRNVDFWQFTGDMIDGYLQTVAETELQYANWKRSIETFAHQTPVFVGMGNHEAVTANFARNNGEYGAAVDRFPFESQSAEAVFAKNFVNFENGPVSEDGAYYDPDISAGAESDFPAYTENVFSYKWDNVGMLVMNSNYWYAPDPAFIPLTSGNPHAYIMDVQLKWLKGSLRRMEEDSTIDHVFVTLHTPPFPNGGHKHDDMWYDGNNDIRPYIAGQPHEKGIIERRDEFLDLVINFSSKTVAVLCGDEHNYSRLRITDSMPRYPDNYDKPRLKLKRDFWQLTNGSAGAPYYAMQKLPWSDNVEVFSTQNAFILFHINGKHIDAEVINPETLQPVEQFRLR